MRWLRIADWKLPVGESVRSAFTLIRKPLNIIEAEGRLLGAAVEPGPLSIRSPATTPAVPERSILPALEGIVARIDGALQRKRQVILFGPPGTGKTYWAERAIDELAARAWFNAERLSSSMRDELRRVGALEVCSFHPAYGYEDFLEGYRPQEKSGQLTFAVQPGVFKRFCLDASKQPERPFFILIDEINRGDIPRIFGELLTVLEGDKRGKAVRLPLSGENFAVPKNVFVVGTMNTADRSIALLDAALRRRFGFVELLPDSSTLRGVSVAGVPLGPWLDELNRRIVKHTGKDARHLQVGHSYLLPAGAPVRELAQFAEILREEIIPLLEEYCYEDFDALERILGSAMMRKAEQRVDSELFLPEKHLDLVDRLLSSFSAITASSEAVEGVAAAEDEETPESDPSLESEEMEGP